MKLLGLRLWRTQSLTACSITRTRLRSEEIRCVNGMRP
jgi:hypothetical protein